MAEMIEEYNMKTVIWVHFYILLQGGATSRYFIKRTRLILTSVSLDNRPYFVFQPDDRSIVNVIGVNDI